MRKLFIILILVAWIITIKGQDQTVGLFENDYRSFNGYTLFNPMPSYTAYLIDNCGFVVNSWESQYKASNAVYLLEDGGLLRTCRTNTIPDAGGRLEKFDWDGNLVWEYNFSTDYSFHHDIQPLPNGNILIISNDIYTPTEANDQGRDPFTMETEFWSEKIVEIQPVGTDSMNIVWEWKAWDHLIQDFSNAKLNYGIVADHPELIDINYWASTGQNALTDWLHFNSVNYNAQRDQIILCSRNLCEIYIIDHSTTTAEAASHTGGIYGKGGDILYRYGNPEAYDRGTINDRKFFFQHYGHWIPPGYPNEDRILVYNNQVATGTSSVNIFTPEEDSAGYYTDPGIQAYGPDEMDWEYITTDYSSPRISSAQEMPNGNILICAGTSGHFVEIDKDGNLFWDYVNPVGNAGVVSQGQVPVLNTEFMALRYPPDFPGFAGHDLTPGDPVELNPWPSNCEILQDTLIELDLKVYLEGAFIGEGMSSTNDFIPLDQPFDKNPWNYWGTEKIGELPGNDYVDWVMLELRDAAIPDNAVPSTRVMRQAALLKTDGSVVLPDGISNPEFYNTIIDDLFVVIHHRNHLSVMSATPLQEGTQTFTYDFTDDAAKTYGGILGCEALSSGKWGMIAGDGNVDETINLSDQTGVWQPEAGISGYNPGDYNNDGEVDNLDKNELFLNNINKSSQVPQ